MPKLSIIICAYNESKTILSILDRVRAARLSEGWSKEILVVDNCSTDGTRELLGHLKWPEVRVILQPANLGKGNSVRTGYAQATGDYAVIQDADLEYDPEDLESFTRAVDQTGASAVFGSRTLGGRAIYKYAANYWGVRFLTTIFNLLFGARLTDIAVATKLVRLDIARGLGLKGHGFDLDFELPCKLRKRGHAIVEVPVSYHPRTVQEGKKLKAIETGLLTVWVFLRERLTP
jgi:dolichol-phosphate mannosyltransferase